MTPELNPALTPQRWICWPHPDRVCVEGGCMYCTPDPDDTEAHLRSHFRRMTRDQVIEYATANGMVIDPKWIEVGMYNRAVVIRNPVGV